MTAPAEKVCEACENVPSLKTKEEETEAWLRLHHDLIAELEKKPHPKRKICGCYNCTMVRVDLEALIAAKSREVEELRAERDEAVYHLAGQTGAFGSMATDLGMRAAMDFRNRPGMAEAIARANTALLAKHNARPRPPTNGEGAYCGVSGHPNVDHPGCPSPEVRKLDGPGTDGGEGGL